MSQLNLVWNIMSSTTFITISLLFTFAIVFVPVFIFTFITAAIHYYLVKHLERYWDNASETEIINALHSYLYNMNVDHFTANVTKKYICNVVSSLSSYDKNRFYQTVYSNGLLPRAKMLLNNDSPKHTYNLRSRSATHNQLE